MGFLGEYNSDDSFQKCKARLVAKGFNQKPGFHFIENFSPVIKLVIYSKNHINYCSF